MYIREILKARNLTREQADRPSLLKELLESEPDAEDLKLLALRLQLQQRAEKRWDPWQSCEIDRRERRNVLLNNRGGLVYTSDLRVTGVGAARIAAMEAAASAPREEMDLTIKSMEITEEEGEFRCVLELQPYYAASYLSALTALGEEYMQDRDEDQGFALLELAAGYGYEPAACLLLAWHDRCGNKEAASKWYTYILTQWGSEALRMLGMTFLPFWSDAPEDDRPGDLPMALLYLREAAEAGSWRAMRKLAEIYETPDYGVQDLTASREWRERARRGEAAEARTF